MNSIPRSSSFIRVFCLGLTILLAVTLEPVWAGHDEDGPVPVTTVTIEGVTAGEVGTAYQFVAQIAPKDATDPILYLWTPTPESEQDNSVATYQWDEPGTYTLKVNASGALDKTVFDLHTVEITTTAVTVAAMDISLTSPAPLVVGETATATIQLQPTDASGYSVVWTPEPERGQGKRQATFAWSTPGVHVVSVQLTNADESTVTALVVVAVEDQDGTLGPTIFVPFVANETAQVHATGY